MDSSANMEEKLWNYIDGNVTAEERDFVGRLLQSSKEWQDKYNELVKINKLMQESIELEGPPMRFTQNVMEEVARLPILFAAKNYINRKTIIGIVSFFALTFLALVLYGAAQINWSAPAASAMPVDFKVPPIDYNKIFSSAYVNIFIMVNIVLGFVLLDVYLARKRKGRQESGNSSMI
jgi:hypothetical protein